MNWVTTNIRIPEDDYLELRLEALEKRKSIAFVIREKITKKKNGDSTNTLTMEMDEFAKKMAKTNKGINLSKELIKMRYEQ